MLKEPGPTQHELEMVTLEELVPCDHLLRRIDAVVDFTFIRDEVRHLYCDDNGRPALDPVVLFKALFIGYLFGIRSERQLVRELQVNVAYRWFLGLRLTDKVPDASTFSQNRRRRFRDSDIAQRLFDRIVEQAMERGLVGGRILYTDSTHIKANANRHHYTVEDVEVTPQAYLAELEEAITEDREAHGKKPLPPRKEAAETARKKISKTDPDSGYMVREGKPKGFFYLDHRTVDAKHTIITDVHVTPASVHDSVPYLERLDRQSERFGFEVEAVGLDAGYFTAAICQGLDKRELYGVIGYRRPNKPKGMMAKRLFVYDETADVYRCPEGQALRYATTNRQGYRHYQSDPAWCRRCPRLAECTRNDKQQKTVTRHVWEAAKERVNRHRLEPKGQQVYLRRKETVERSFADAKQLHGYRYAQMRGLAGMREQALLSAAAQNLKKMALAA